MLTLALGLSTLAVLLYAAYEIRASRREYSTFRAKYFDALGAITSRAEAAEALAASLSRTVEGFRDSIGDRKRAETLESSVAYLQERLTESSRSLVALTDLKAGQVVVKQGREQEPVPEPPARPSLWSLASGKASTTQAPVVPAILKQPHGD